MDKVLSKVEKSNFFLSSDIKSPSKSLCFSCFHSIRTLSNCPLRIHVMFQNCWNNLSEIVHFDGACFGFWIAFVFKFQTKLLQNSILIKIFEFVEVLQNDWIWKRSFWKTKKIDDEMKKTSRHGDACNFIGVLRT